MCLYSIFSTYFVVSFVNENKSKRKGRSQKMAFSVVLFLTMNAFINADLSNYVGLDLSVGLQSNPINPTKQATALNTVNVNRFRLYFNDANTANQIIRYKPNAKFSLELTASAVARGITSNDVLNLLAPFASIANNIDMIFVSNEPLNAGAGVVRFDQLNKALRTVINTVHAHNQYKHIQVSIPFSLTAVTDTYPVSNGNFIEPRNGDAAVNSNGACRNCVKSNTLSNSYMKQILNTYYQYKMPFSIQVYPFFVCAYGNANLINYCLGSQKGSGGDGKMYNGMIEAQYVTTKMAIIDLMGFNGNYIEIIISETGWPSYSTSVSVANPNNAFTYYKNSLRIMQIPSSELYQKRVYFFEAFDENLKGPSGNHENHFGWFDLNGNPKYNFASMGLNTYSAFNSMTLLDSNPSNNQKAYFKWFQYCITGTIILIIVGLTLLHHIKNKYQSKKPDQQQSPLNEDTYFVQI